MGVELKQEGRWTKNPVVGGGEADVMPAPQCGMGISEQGKHGLGRQSGLEPFTGTLLSADGVGGDETQAQLTWGRGFANDSACE